MSVSLGADPEIFLRHKDTNELLSAAGCIGGSKARPKSLGNDGFAIQEDNVMVEFNVPPSSRGVAFARSIKAGLAMVNDYVQGKIPDAVFDPRCEVVFGESLLQHPGAMTFGCSADYNAYEQGAQCSPVDPAMLKVDDGQRRFAGGHVHLGWSAAKGIPHYVAASFADIYLGLPSVGTDVQPERRKLYGQAGRFRPTSYGIEYRTLSNFWIQDTRSLEFICNSAERLLRWMESVPVSDLRRHYKATPWADIRTAINTDDAGLAASLLLWAKKEGYAGAGR